MRTTAGRPLLAFLLAISLAGTACEASPGATLAPSRLPASPTAVPPEPSKTPPAPTAVPSPSLSPVSDAPLAAGMLAVTVTDGLRVRSAPRVAADSVKHTPLLPDGTELVITAGPVQANDYTWYRVAPVGFALDDNVDQGWVAIADHDGTPWVAAAADPTPGFELAAVTTEPIDSSMTAAKARADGINRFGFALYRRLRADPTLADRGIVVSPYSIATALAMARAGAAGETAAEMDSVLRASGWPALAKGTASLATVLARRDGAWVVNGDGETGTHFLALRMANMAFAQQGYALEQAYLERVSRTFRSGFGLVDYEADPEGARRAINGWVAQQTLGRIPGLLQPPNVTVDTRLVLVNAVYFKGEWLVPFYDGSTSPRAFTTAAGDTVRVPTMETRGEQDIPLATGDGWKATELRYLAPDNRTPLAMTIIRPDDLAAFERRLTATRFRAVTDSLARERERLQEVRPGDEWGCGQYAYQVRLFMPKFGIDTRADLGKTLAAMGMPLAFDVARADFSGMTTTDPTLHIGFVIHQANIDVDERGTEAAAATAVGVDTGGCTGPVPAKERTLRLDRPFLYFVRDLQTGAILFMGRVTDPTVR